MLEAMIERVRQCFEELPEHRQPSNNTKYRISDAALSALSVYFMQSPSFLAHQRDMDRKRGRNDVIMCRACLVRMKFPVTTRFGS